VRRVLLSFAPVAAAACSTALPESDLAALLPLGPGVAERFVLEVEIDSPGLTGTFDGVLVTRPDPPAVRFQLLPDLGAPILDVCATPEGVAGVMHGHGELQRWPAADKASAPELLLLFGITLLEQHAQVTRERVLAASAGTPVHLRLRGVYPGTTVEKAEVAGRSVRGRCYRYGAASWRDHLDSDVGTVEGPRFRLRARVIAREAAGDLADDVFHLDAAP